MSVIASGRTADADSWELRVSTDPVTGDLLTLVQVTTAGGSKPWGDGCGGQVPPRQRLDTYFGAGDTGPRILITRVASGVRAVVVTLSDGTREDLVLHRVPGHEAIKVGVLVYPRDLDVHRVDLVDTEDPSLAP
jgi:hypothetical protein